jgi:predicted RNA-binding Zn ribbon-like protein
MEIKKMERKKSMRTVERNADRETPEPLALIQAVVNTRYGRTRADDWQSPEQVRAWLIHHRLLARETPVLQGDQRRLIEVREALRGLLRGNNGKPADPEQVETLNHIAKHAPLIVHFRQDGSAKLVPDIEGVDGVISLLLGIVFVAMADGTWTRLKVCRNERCQKAFYDSSRNHSGTWCAMAKCGSRVKARTYRQRQQKRVEEVQDR